MYLQKALRGTLVVFILSLIGGLFGYFMRFFLARKLTVEEFGLFYSVLAVLLFMSYIVDLGLGQAVSRKIVEFTVNDRRHKINNLLMSMASVQVIVSVILGALLIIFRKFLSEKYFHGDVSTIMIFGVVWLVLVPILAIYSNIFSGLQRPEYSNFLATSQSMLLLGLSMLFVYMGHSVLSPALAYAFSSAILVIIFYFFAKKMYPDLSISRFNFDRDLTVKTAKFGLIIGVSNFIWLIMLQTDTMLITYFMTSADVGLYQVAVTISYLLLYLPNSLYVVLYPLVNSLIFTKRYDRIIEAVRLVHKYLLVLLIPAVVIIASFSKSIISILFTDKYLGASASLSILVVYILFCSITIINNLILTSLGNPSKVLWVVAIASVLNLVLNLITIPMFGLVGAAGSTLFSFIVAAALSSYQLKRSIKIIFPIKEWFVLLLISAVLILETRYLIRHILLGVLAKIMVIALIVLVSYSILLFVFRILDLKELKHLVMTFLGK